MRGTEGGEGGWTGGRWSDLEGGAWLRESWGAKKCDGRGVEGGMWVKGGVGCGEKHGVGRMLGRREVCGAGRTAEEHGGMRDVERGTRMRGTRVEKAGGREEDGVTWRESDLEKGILGSKEVRWRWFGRDVAWSAGWDVGRSMGWGAG